MTKRFLLKKIPNKCDNQLKRFSYGSDTTNMEIKCCNWFPLRKTGETIIADNKAGIIKRLMRYDDDCYYDPEEFEDGR